MVRLFFYMEGIIEYINTEKGYGFIKIDGYEKNVFFHARDLFNTSFDDVKKGDAVSIKEVVESEKGNSAKGVKLID